MKKILFLSLLSIFTFNLFCSEESGDDAAASVVLSASDIKSKVVILLAELKPALESRRKQLESSLLDSFKELDFEEVLQVADKLNVRPAGLMLSLCRADRDKLIEHGGILKAYTDKTCLFTEEECNKAGEEIYNIRRLLINIKKCEQKLFISKED